MSKLIPLWLFSVDTDNIAVVASEPTPYFCLQKGG